MADVESLLNLERDEAEVIDFLTEHCGALERDTKDGSAYWVTVRPKSVPDETYFARIAWEAYPHKPPSVRFADRTSGNLNVASAWPVAPGYRARNFDICKPFTAEGFALHPDWRAGPHAWRATGNPFLWVVSMIQRDLDVHYSGRAR